MIYFDANDNKCIRYKLEKLNNVTIVITTSLPILFRIENITNHVIMF